MEWAILPPEINSARIYAGPGSTPLTQAASAWGTLAAELGTTSEAFGQVVAGLTRVWLGPSSLSMQTVALTYQAWLMETSALCQDTATRVLSAAAAYEAAFAATVPPPLIAANRATLASLVATNFLGINTPSIMATEAQYLEMWMQDVTAMSAYQAASAQAVALTPFTPPAPLMAGPQAAALPGIQDVLSALQDPTTGWVGLANEYLVGLLSSGAPIDILGLFSSMWAVNGMSFQDALSSLGADPNSVVTYTPPLDSPTITITPSRASVPLDNNVSVSVGTAGKAGSLSVPQSWAKSFAEASPSVSPLMDDQLIIPPIPLLGAKREAPEPVRYGIRLQRVTVSHPSAG